MRMLLLTFHSLTYTFYQTTRDAIVTLCFISYIFKETYYIDTYFTMDLLLLKLLSLHLV